jgi:hypothetical protein
VAALIAPQVQVIVRDQEHAEGVVVAIAAGESLENGPTPLRFLRSKTHVGPLGKACLGRGYTSRIYAGRLCGATPTPPEIGSGFGCSALADVCRNAPPANPADRAALRVATEPKFW